MSFETFIPKLWASAIEVPYKKSLVFGQENIASTKFQQILQQGGKSISIPLIGEGAVRDHDRNTDLTYDDLSMTDIELVMDQEKYFGFYVSDVDKAQVAGDFQGPATQEHAEKLANASDTFVAAKIKDEAGTKLGNTEVFDGSQYHIPASGQRTAWDILRDLSVELNTVSAPSINRWVIVGPKFGSALLAAPQLTQADKAGTDNFVRNGLIAALPSLGFSVLSSNNVPTVAGREVIAAGVPGAVAYASQLREIEAIRAEKRFADIVRGLHIYGAKVVRPKGLVTIEADVKPGTLPTGAVSTSA